MKSIQQSRRQHRDYHRKLQGEHQHCHNSIFLRSGSQRYRNHNRPWHPGAAATRLLLMLHHQRMPIRSNKIWDISGKMVSGRCGKRTAAKLPLLLLAMRQFPASFLRHRFHRNKISHRIRHKSNKKGRRININTNIPSNHKNKHSSSNRYSHSHRQLSLPTISRPICRHMCRHSSIRHCLR